MPRGSQRGKGSESTLTQFFDRPRWPRSHSPEAHSISSAVRTPPPPLAPGLSSMYPRHAFLLPGSRPNPVAGASRPPSPRARPGARPGCLVGPSRTVRHFFREGCPLMQGRCVDPATRPTFSSVHRRLVSRLPDPDRATGSVLRALGGAGPGPWRALHARAQAVEGRPPGQFSLRDHLLDVPP